MLFTNSLTNNFVWVYGDFSFSVEVTAKYAKNLKEYLHHHMGHDLSHGNFNGYYNIGHFTYIIDNDIFDTYLRTVEENKVTERYIFSDEPYIIANVNGCNIFMQKDVMIVYRVKNQICIYVRENQQCLYQFLRVVREIIYRTQEDRNRVFMHAAACERSGHGILILGEKGAGKTTLLNYFLDKGSDYVANNRLFLISDKDKIYIECFPIPMRVSKETMKKTKKFEITSKLYRINLANTNKYLITPLEINSLYSVNTLYSSNLSYIIIPKISINDTRFSITECNPSNALDVFKMNCFTPYDESRHTQWIASCNLSKLKLEENAKNIMNKMLEYPIYQVEYGTLLEPEFIIAEINKYIK